MSSSKINFTHFKGSGANFVLFDWKVSTTLFYLLDILIEE